MRFKKYLLIPIICVIIPIYSMLIETSEIGSHCENISLMKAPTNISTEYIKKLATFILSLDESQMKSDFKTMWQHFKIIQNPIELLCDQDFLLMLNHTQKALFLQLLTQYNEDALIGLKNINKLIDESQIEDFRHLELFQQNQSLMERLHEMERKWVSQAISDYKAVLKFSEMVIASSFYIMPTLDTSLDISLQEEQESNIDSSYVQSVSSWIYNLYKSSLTYFIVEKKDKKEEYVSPFWVVQFGHFLNNLRGDQYFWPRIFIYELQAKDEFFMKRRDELKFLRNRSQSIDFKASLLVNIVNNVLNLILIKKLIQMGQKEIQPFFENSINHTAFLQEKRKELKKIDLVTRFYLLRLHELVFFLKPLSGSKYPDLGIFYEKTEIIEKHEYEVLKTYYPLFFDLAK